MSKATLLRQRSLTSNSEIASQHDTCDGTNALRCLDDAFSRPTVGCNKKNNRNSAGTASPMTPLDLEAHPVAPWLFIASWAGLALSLTFLFFIALGGLNLG